MNLKKILSSLCCLNLLWSQADASQKLVGKAAPLFTGKAVFPDNSVHDFRLKDYVGHNIVLYFYPMDNTPGCTLQAKTFRDDIAKFQEQKIIVIGVSCDSITSHQAFQKKYNLPFYLISDSRWWRTISKLYGAAGFLYSKRKTFLINKKGNVFKVFENVNMQTQTCEILESFADIEKN